MPYLELETAHIYYDEVGEGPAILTTHGVSPGKGRFFPGGTLAVRIVDIGGAENGPCIPLPRRRSLP